MARRIWTLAEANAALLRIQEMVDDAQQKVAHMQEAKGALEVLQVEHGDAIVMADHGAHALYRDALDKFHRARRHLGAILRGFEDLGVEVKDLSIGLLDFRAQMGGAEVYLCWMQGEKEVGHWHTLDGGYAARQPIPDFGAVGR